MVDPPPHSRPTLIATATAALLLCSACALFGPDLSVASGGYTLESVDGVALPVAIEGGDCPLEIFEGDLGLDPEINNRRPMFGTIVEVRLECDPDRPLTPEFNPLIRDAGGWTVIGNSVQLRSNQGFGNQMAPMEPSPPGETGPILTLHYGERNYTFRRVSRYGDPL